MVVSQSTQASVILTPYLSPEGPDMEKYIRNRRTEYGKAKRTIFRNVLPAGVDVGFDHDTGDRAVTGNQLLANRVYDLWLVVVVLKRISV
jgi:hypothetical protein